MFGCAMTFDSARPLSVCLVSAAYRPYPSGVSEHVANLASALQDKGHNVHVLTTSYGGAHEGDAASEPIAVTRLGRVVMVPLNGSYATFPWGRDVPARVRKFLEGNTFDIVHGHGVFWPEISYWAVRYSSSVNVVTFLSAPFRTSRRGAGTYRWLFRRHLARINGRIAISRRAREAFAPYVPGDSRIIPCGVDLRRFQPDVRPDDAVSGPGPVVLFVGRLDRRKGLLTLIDAIKGLRATVPGCRLVVAGEGPQRRSAEVRANELGLAEAVTFVGRVADEDLPGFYAGADVYCSPALGGEALGIVLLEAMASGTPVVASDIPGYDETVRRDVDGLLVAPGDSHALAAALADVLRDHDLAARLARSGLQRASSYSWSSVADMTIAYYRELLRAAEGQPAASASAGPASQRPD